MAHVLITGASSGIGEALAREFSRGGDAVTLVARRGEVLRALAAALPGKSHVIAADLSDPARAVAVLDEATAALGPIDVLINNAGAQIVAPIQTVSAERADAMMRLDLTTPMRLTAAVLPGMLQRKSGVIVDIASLAALAPTPGMAYYNAAKAGLAAFSEGLRGELRGTGVHVLTVYPGPVDTPLARAAYDNYPPMARMLPGGRPEVLARRVRRAVLRRKTRVIYPLFYVLARHFPGVTRWLMDNFAPKALPPPAPPLKD